MTKYCYLNGKISPLNRAKISINDIGILRGFGIFEFLRSYNGKPFLIQEHLDRLEKSAKMLNLKIPISKKEIKSVIEKLLKKNKIKDAVIRIVITGGNSDDGMSYSYNSPTFYILIKESPAAPSSIYENGVKLITFEHKREIPQAKTTNYLTMIKLKALKEKKNASEILYVSDGLILEGATCNFFIFKGNTLITPKDDVLIGTRRNLVLKLARDKFKVEERLLESKEVNEATEAFITSTTREIVPVVKIDDNKIGNGKVGQNTKHLINLFRKYTAN